MQKDLFPFFWEMRDLLFVLRSEFDRATIVDRVVIDHENGLVEVGYRLGPEEPECVKRIQMRAPSVRSYHGGG